MLPEKKYIYIYNPELLGATGTFVRTPKKKKKVEI